MRSLRHGDLAQSDLKIERIFTLEKKEHIKTHTKKKKKRAKSMVEDMQNQVVVGLNVNAA